MARRRGENNEFLCFGMSDCVPRIVSQSQAHPPYQIHPQTSHGVVVKIVPSSVLIASGDCLHVISLDIQTRTRTGCVCGLWGTTVADKVIRRRAATGSRPSIWNMSRGLIWYGNSSSRKWYAQLTLSVLYNTTSGHPLYEAVPLSSIPRRFVVAVAASQYKYESRPTKVTVNYNGDKCADRHGNGILAYKTYENHQLWHVWVWPW